MVLKGRCKCGCTLQEDRSRQAVERKCLLTMLQEHPCLVKCHARVLDPFGQPCGMAMELLGGGDLSAAVR
jgi:hypothetical protein